MSRETSGSYFTHKNQNNDVFLGQFFKMLSYFHDISAKKKLSKAKEKNCECITVMQEKDLNC